MLPWLTDMRSSFVESKANLSNSRPFISSSPITSVMSLISSSKGHSNFILLTKVPYIFLNTLRHSGDSEITFTDSMSWTRTEFSRSFSVGAIWVPIEIKTRLRKIRIRELRIEFKDFGGSENTQIMELNWYWVGGIRGNIMAKYESIRRHGWAGPIINLFFQRWPIKG